MKMTFTKMALIIGLLFFSLNTAIAQAPETDVSSDFNFTMKSENINGTSIAYYEQGKGDPVLFFHGIPENSFTWRNVVPTVAKAHRAIAIDLVGYGKSSLPPNQDYSIQAQYNFIEGFIERLQLKNVTIVVTDIGSFYGLKYAIKNQDNIKGIVLMESMYMPAKLWYKQLKLKQKMMFWMMRSEGLSKKMIVTKNKVPAMMLKMGVKRKLSEKEVEGYASPYKEDIERRKVMLYGPGPATVPKKGISQTEGDFADELDKIAEGLLQLNTTKPFLLIHAKPGFIVRKKAIGYAKENFKNCTFLNVGEGKHLLQEDHPKAIAAGIVNWIKSI
jgi:haloalkane dehalogenase